MSAGTDTWHQATVETTLQPGDTIKAGGNSRAEITFFEGSTIELEPSAQISVSEIGISDTGSTTIRLAQQLGKTISRVKKLVDADSRYEIETPAAIAAVRGSTMVVTVDSTGKTVVANESGDIRVIVDGKDYIIHEGMQRSIIPGEEPSPETWTNPPAGGGGGGSPQLARVEVTMQAEPAEARPGDTITYTYRLHNTGDLPFHDISVSNNVSGNATYQSGDVNSNSVLNPEETWVFTSTYTVKADDPPSLVATATISATTSTSVTVVDTETATTTIWLPGIAITKTSRPITVHVGDNITYTYTVTNAGNTPLFNIQVNDDRIQESVIFVSDDSNGDDWLDVQETWIFTANYTVNGQEPDLLVNTANATGMDNTERSVSASDNATVAILKPGIAMDKTADKQEAHVGDNITYFYEVTNDGNTPLSNILMTDNLIENIIFVSGDEDGDERLDIGESWIYTANYTVGAGAPDSLINTANVSGRDILEKTVTASDSVSVAILRPGIAIVKTANPVSIRVGGTITYTYTVTNTGNTAMANVTVNDDRLGIIPYVSGDDGDQVLEATETWIFQATHVATWQDPRPLVNTAVVYGTDALSWTVTDYDTASVQFT